MLKVLRLRDVLTEPRADKWALALFRTMLEEDARAKGIDPDEYNDLMMWTYESAPGKRKPGRPIANEGKLRQSTIKALVAVDCEGIAWRDVVPRFCTCDQRHTPAQISRCQKTMAANVRKLRRLLKRRGIESWMSPDERQLITRLGL